MSLTQPDGRGFKPRAWLAAYTRRASSAGKRSIDRCAEGAIITRYGTSLTGRFHHAGLPHLEFFDGLLKGNCLVLSRFERF